MKKLILITLFSILSCNPNTKTSSDENVKIGKEQKMENTPNMENVKSSNDLVGNNDVNEINKNKFPVSEVVFNNFVHFPEYKGDGPSYELNVKLQNLSGNKITSCKINYFIETIFEDNTILYSPIDFNPQIQKRGDEIFDSANILNVSLQKGEYWLPNEEKNFDFVVFGNWGPYWSKINFDKKIFERTPKSANFILKFNAISVEKEYTFFIKSDILEYWKKYQTEIGLR